MAHLKKETGTAFIVTSGLLFLIMLLGVATCRWALDDIGISANQKGAVQARYIAESGTALILQWFQSPETFPGTGDYLQGYSGGEAGRFLSKRMIDSRGRESFFNEDGESQFIGTAQSPDYWYHSESEPSDGTGQAWVGLGVLTDLKLFGPTTVGAIASVEATGATVSGIGRTVRVEVFPIPIPPPVAAVQVGPGSDGPVPLLVHWGDVLVSGDADLGGDLLSIPQKNSTAPVDGRPYPAGDRRDAWLDFLVGDLIRNPDPACADCVEPFLSEGYGHLHQIQNAIHKDFGLDRWDYRRLKAFAKTHGVYFGTDREGFLYPEGIMDPLRRMLPSQVLSQSRGFVFVDTVDQRPPDGSNLATLDLPVDYMEGIYSIQAHLVIHEAGFGPSIEVRSPPFEGSNDPSGRRPVILTSVNLKGVLSVTGRLTVEGHPRIFGALIAQGGFSGSGSPEVWYDADLRTGYYSGLPVVTLLKGSWYTR